ncbi:hypothetical protein [Kangiella sediminilitoris]|uniref:Uncharacterized protein n=1 Tax=Kangiella sediminilitoris TaxID=1144748 RepID=A0A1B3BBD2_9GAMM|nr:hypothetical protein [Kangiella sediminilitoris]AOE50102.1 hypothetical protein KS2013_1390 [Kangiella sediminilitoris]
MSLLVTACACSSCAPAPNLHEMMPKAQADFFTLFKNLCGKTFVGSTVYPNDPNHDFANKKLIATVEECHNRVIRIPFTVGDDKSRTWVLIASYQGLLFKHDHRHEDGTPDRITNYGGYSAKYKKEPVTATKQFFHADEFTANLIPDAKTNVWMLEYKPETKELVYYLERHGKPRYKALLKQVN